MIQHLFFVIFGLHYGRKEAGQETVHETAQKHEAHTEKPLEIAYTRDITIAHGDNCGECEVDRGNVYIPVRGINQTLLVDPIDF